MPTQALPLYNQPMFECCQTGDKWSTKYARNCIAPNLASQNISELYINTLQRKSLRCWLVCTNFNRCRWPYDYFSIHTNMLSSSDLSSSVQLISICITYFSQFATLPLKCFYQNCQPSPFVEREITLLSHCQTHNRVCARLTVTQLSQLVVQSIFGNSTLCNHHCHLHSVPQCMQLPHPSMHLFPATAYCPGSIVRYLFAS